MKARKIVPVLTNFNHSRQERQKQKQSVLFTVNEIHFNSFFFGFLFLSPPYDDVTFPSPTVIIFLTTFFFFSPPRISSRADYSVKMRDSGVRVVASFFSPSEEVWESLFFLIGVTFHLATRDCPTAP